MRPATNPEIAVVGALLTRCEVRVAQNLGAVAKLFSPVQEAVEGLYNSGPRQKDQLIFTLVAIAFLFPLPIDLPHSIFFSPCHF